MFFFSDRHGLRGEQMDPTWGVSEKGHTSLLTKEVKHGRDADSRAGREEFYHLSAR